MKGLLRFRHVLPLLLLCACSSTPTPPPPPPAMSFFVTSASPGRGGDLGGLEGADRHCQALADQVGSKLKTWRAYLSQQSDLARTTPSINARDRIGTGPWHNAKGQLIAGNLDELHGAGNRISKETALSERGEPTPGRFHDIMTGTRQDGSAPSPLDVDMTCRNWTSQADEAAGALVGHFDRVSAIKEDWAKSWNYAHRSRGCSAPKLAELGSGGLLYCFAK